MAKKRKNITNDRSLKNKRNLSIYNIITAPRVNRDKEIDKEILATEKKFINEMKKKTGLDFKEITIPKCSNNFISNETLYHIYKYMYDEYKNLYEEAKKEIKEFGKIYGVEEDNELKLPFTAQEVEEEKDRYLRELQKILNILKNLKDSKILYLEDLANFDIYLFWDLSRVIMRTIQAESPTIEEEGLIKLLELSRKYVIKIVSLNELLYNKNIAVLGEKLGKLVENIAINIIKQIFHNK